MDQKTSTLGELLKANEDLKKRELTEAKAAEQCFRTEADRANAQVSRQFFEKARTFFTNGIKTGLTTKEMTLQVGGKRFAAAGRDTHEAFDSVLAGYHVVGDGTPGKPRMPYSLTKYPTVAPYWVEFQNWAAENGLKPRWDYCHDGCGMESWWQLCIEAVPAKN